MSFGERNGFRDQAYSHWHRTALPHEYGQIDVDWIEFCARCRETYALVETARYIPSMGDKPSSVLALLGVRAEIPAFTVLYEAGPCGSLRCGHGMCPGETVVRVHVRLAMSQLPWEVIEPDEWVHRLGALRQRHDRRCAGRIDLSAINRIRQPGTSA